MKRVLALCFFSFFVSLSNGGELRLFQFYRALSRWHHVTLLTSTHMNVPEEVIHHGVNFVERRIPKDGNFVRQHAALAEYSGGGDLSGPAIAACGRLPTRLHQAYLEEYEKADVIFHDSPFTVYYDLFAEVDHKPRIYNAHNCEMHLYAQLHPHKKCQPIHDIVRAAEHHMLKIADLVLYCNQEDLKAFRELAPDGRFEVLYVPHGIEPRVALPPAAFKDSAFRAVFIGSGHPPNRQAAEFIAYKLAPALPDITFDIIGSCLPEGRYAPNLVRHGVVDDETKSRILASAQVALNPMVAGSGSNVKILEYFAYGLPVLSTSFGMRGIMAEPGKHYVQAPLDGFVEALQDASHAPAALAAIGAAAKELALKNYLWNHMACLVGERVEALVNSRKNGEQKRFVLVLNDYDSFSGIGGGCTRTRCLYKAVQDWSPVVFVCFSEDGTLTARKDATGIAVINVPKTSDHMADLARMNAMFYVAADDIVAGRHSTANPWLNVIYGILRQSARCIVVEHCYLARLPHTWGDRFVYSSQNNETELKKRLLEGHPLARKLCETVECLERLAVECSAATIAVSLEDAENLVVGKRTSGPIVIVRNGAEMPAEGESVEQKKREVDHDIGPRAAVFLGSAHMPNVYAAQFIVQRLALQCPDVRFHLLGSVCQAISKVPSNVRLWGVVDEITKCAIMQSCAVGLNPMTAGSGSNVKLADYLGNGLYVVTTEFGIRGYPSEVRKYVSVVPIEAFASAIRQVVANPDLYSKEAKADRRTFFERRLAMRSIAQRFVQVLKDVTRRKKRVLVVTYRYTNPILGGAEAYIEKCLHALGNSGNFDVDVVAPEVSGIHNHFRFSEDYTFDAHVAVPVDIPNVRFARFPADKPNPRAIENHLRKAWTAQAIFERVLDQLLRAHYRENGLTWGWGDPEGKGQSVTRWAFTECGLYVSQPSRIELKASTSKALMVTVYVDNDIIAGPVSVDGSFSLVFETSGGNIRFVTSSPHVQEDPRPLAFRVFQLLIQGQSLNLSSPTLLKKHLSGLPAKKIFHVLDQASFNSRYPLGVRLTDGRGPWSSTMECFIADHVKDYDLVVTHNNVFRPAVVAISEAKKHQIPSILIPHAHLDDDFYHFPDWLECAQNASLVLAVPKAACDFLAEKGCNVRYLPGGCDTDEKFTPQDQEAFRKIYKSKRPFVLVLGRKSGAKGYRHLLDAVEQLYREGMHIHAVMIGPDDDGIPLESPHAFYLGQQPRHVVRGALMSCVALCNMSTSESFGMVLLEAWLAGKPVIANKNCAAFHDMAVDGENALLVDNDGIAEAIKRLVQQPDLRRRLAEKGRQQALRFDWRTVSGEFVSICEELTKG